MIRRLAAFILVFILLLPVSAFTELDEDDLFIEDWIELPDEEENTGLFEADGSTIITLTCTGDFTIGGDNRKRKKGSFKKELEKHDDDINFTMANMKKILGSDDLTIVNFEGTFTDTKYVPDSKKNNEFIFNISPSYAHVLNDNSIEAVSLANNHVMDHGAEGYEDTKNTLIEAGVIFSTQEDIGEYTVNENCTIAMLSYLCIDQYGKPVGGYDTFEEKVCADIAQAKKSYPLVIVSFHWGREPTKSRPDIGYIPTDNQLRLGRMAVDAGADLIIGHHSHRIQPIECYKGVYICYSLGNFCFAGNNKPSDMNSIVFQTRFRISKTGEVSNTGFRIIPIQISSVKDRNDYTPTPVTDVKTIDAIISTMLSNGKGFGVEEYPLNWN